MKLNVRSELLIAGCLLVAPLSQAQISAPRIGSRIVETSRVTLRGNTLPAARPGHETGAADLGARSGRMMLVLRRSVDQQAALQSFLDSVQDPGSPNFRKFLTPEEFGSRFGIAASDLSKLSAWLRGHGFEVAGPNKGRTALEFSGTVGQLQQAFQVPIRTYDLDGIRHWANAADPSIPAALSPVVAGIANLNDIRPRPMSIAGPRGAWSESEHRIVPDLTVSISGQTYLFMTPGDAGTIYDVPHSQNMNLAANQTQYDGTGITIGVVGDVNPDDTAVLYYRTLFGLPGNHWGIVIDGDAGTIDPSADQTEALLDSEVSGGLAPGANVTLYTAGNTLFQSGVMLAIYRAIDDNTVNVLSVSYGECEADLGAAGNLQILQAWEQAAAQGIAVTVSSGDNGSAGCDNFDIQQVAQHGLAVNGLASTPYNIAVGGTDFDVLKTSFNNYVSFTNSATFASASKYIPEEPWNDSTSTSGALSANSALKNSKGQTNIVAGSGGPSTLGGVGSTGNSIPYPKPQWQKNFSASNQDSVRDLPDVSLLAGNGLYGALWAVCESGDCTGGNQWSVHGVGGTSASAPAFAGILALVNQKMGASTRLGQPNWILYRLAQSTPSAFHAITSGNNSVYCQTGSPNCNSNNFLSGYNAGANYNFATGLGSVDAANLVNNWSSIALTSTATTLNLSQTSFVHGTPVNVTATVSPSDATGNVAIVNNGWNQDYNASTNTATMLALDAGAAAGSVSELPGGKYNVYANYGGDASHAGSTSQPVAVNVTPEDSIVHLSAYAIDSQGHAINASGQVFPLGTFISMNAQPVGMSQASNSNPVTNATGAVNIYDSFNGGQQSGGRFNLDSTGNAEWNYSAFQAGTHALSALYSGDASYNSSTSPTVNFTISPITPNISVTSNVSTIFSGGAYLYAAISASFAEGPEMSGTVTFTDATNNTVLGSAMPLPGCQVVATQCSTATLSFDVSQLAMGNNSITATYGGDSNYTATGPSPALIINCTAGCSNGTGQTLQLSFFATTPSGALSPGGSSTTSVDVTPGGGFTGAVNFTCVVTGSNPSDAHIPTCAFNPAQVSVTGIDSVASNLAIATTGSSASLQSVPSLWKSSTAALAILFFWLIPARRRRFRALLGLVLLLSVVTAWTSGCGGGSAMSTGGGGGGGGSSGTTPDTYTVTFRAADAATGTVTAQDYFKFTVQ